MQFGFDETKILSREQIAAQKPAKPELSAAITYNAPRAKAAETAPAPACGAPNDLPDADALVAAGAQAEASNGALAACGAPNDLPDADASSEPAGQRISTSPANVM